MLENLEILNGELSPEFDIYNDIYSVSVDENVDKLVIDYQISEGCVLNTIDNAGFTAGENEVYLQVIDGEVINTYTLLVYKESSKPVINYDYLTEPLEIEEKTPEYAIPLISGVSLLILIVVFYLLFHKKKVK